MTKDIQIGVSMALFDDNFLTTLRNGMQKEMQKGHVQGQVEDAKGDVSQQLQQVQNFIGQGVDAIIVNPGDTSAVKPVMDAATKAGIPLVFVNRKPAGELTDKMACVGSDTELAGCLQMEALAKAKAFSLRSLSAKIIGEIESIATLTAAVSSGMGVTVLAESAALALMNSTHARMVRALTAPRSICRCPLTLPRVYRCCPRQRR